MNSKHETWMRAAQKQWGFLNIRVVAMTARKARIGLPSPIAGTWRGIVSTALARACRIEMLIYCPPTRSITETVSRSHFVKCAGRPCGEFRLWPFSPPGDDAIAGPPKTRTAQPWHTPRLDAALAGPPANRARPAPSRPFGKRNRAFGNMARRCSDLRLNACAPASAFSSTSFCVIRPHGF